MKFTFNTGRRYQPNGQIITVLGLQTSTLFKDHSRGICGEIPQICPYMDREANARWVMSLYDTNQYRMSIDAMNLDPEPESEIIKCVS